MVEGILDAQVIYMPSDGQAAQAIRQELPFRIAFQGALPSGASVHLTTHDVQAEGISQDRIELKYRMELSADAVRKQSLTLPVGVRTAQTKPERGGIVMIWPGPGEALWDIAKRVRVTVGSIAKLNPGMEEAKPGKGVLILKK